MGWFGRKQAEVPPHPRKEPRFDLPLNTESIKTAFDHCMDLQMRSLYLAGDREKVLTLVSVAGMVKMERVSDYVLRPLAQDNTLARCSMEEAFERMAEGALYNWIVEVRTTVDQVVGDLIDGNCVLFFPGQERVLSFLVGTEEKRAISPPENEPSIKGARDCFVENLLTNTSLVRRHIKAPELRITRHVVGRQSLTPVAVLWVEGITDPELVKQVEHRIAEIDIDALLSPGNLEEYLVDEPHTPFPVLGSTQRPDRFCHGLMEGRVGVLAEGLPQGFLAPGTVGLCFETGQDDAYNWMVAAAVAVLRYLCVPVTLFLPGLYVAAVLFHPEMIPLKLAQSIQAAKAGVPFTTFFEVMVMLVAFEVVQEAGLRLPGPIGQTVSILGGLVVGSAAVEAKIVSPAVLIVVAVAGIAGYTVPNQDFAGALRLWRLGLAAAGALGGAMGLVLGGMALVCHLAELESFGVAYLTPFAANGGAQVEGHTVLRRPLRRTVLRPAAMKAKNRRNQG